MSLATITFGKLWKDGPVATQQHSEAAIGAAFRNLKTAGGTLVNAVVTNKSGAAIYVQVHDKATPVDTDVPLASFYVPDATVFNLPFPITTNTAIALAISSTHLTLTRDATHALLASFVATTL